MENIKIDGTPVEFDSGNGPIINVHYMDTTEASPARAPCFNRVGSYSNFSGQHDITRANLVQFITRKMRLHPGTKKVVVMFDQP
jgi:hypothetical protein